MVHNTGENEQQIGQAIDVSNQHQIDGRLERHHPPLGAAADRPRNMQRGARGGAAGENEAAQRRQLRFERVNQLLQPHDICYWAFHHSQGPDGLEYAIYGSDGSDWRRNPEVDAFKQALGTHVTLPTWSGRSPLTTPCCQGAGIAMA